MATLQLGPRRATYLDVSELSDGDGAPLAPDDVEALESLDLIYRSLCAILYNYVPRSGHPGGSISSGRIAIPLVFDALDYDLSDPDRRDADVLSYAAGHKALGLYALWALRNEIARIGAPELLPNDVRLQLRLEDLLGFRRNPTSDGPLFRELRAKALDGHPTPATPFVRLSTGASGVGIASSLGLALGAADLYGAAAPRVHLIDGEGGMTPGRVAEALAMAGTASLGNAILHVDWNNASIDTERVCRDDGGVGDYVQWDPRELAFLNDWNVIYVPDGTDLQQVVAAQRHALAEADGQPTAIVYRTTKGWRYGITGRASHGAGHKLCSPRFVESVSDLLEPSRLALPTCPPGEERCARGSDGATIEACFWEALTTVRGLLERNRPLVATLAERLRRARTRLVERARTPRDGAPRIDAVFEVVARHAGETPSELQLLPGGSTTLRAELGRALGYLNRASGGAFLAAAADLLGSTSTNLVGQGFPAGFWNARENPAARTVAIGGICEDAMMGVLTGASAFGAHLGVGSSYGAFIAPLGHIAARLHAIGGQARHAIAADEPLRTAIMVCAHAGLKTGEDGPTHADPQPLQLLQENFPAGTVVTLTPWEPQEIWPLLAAALARRPALVAPFVTRPEEHVLDRAALGLAPPAEAAQGVYRLRRASRPDAAGAVVLQGSGVTYAFVEDALPRLAGAGLDLDVWYVASAELFDALPAAEQARIFPPEVAARAMGITGFTLPTMYRWITSPRGRAATLHPFRSGHYLGSGAAEGVLREAGLDGESQARAVLAYFGAA